MCTTATLSPIQYNWYWARTCDFAIDYFSTWHGQLAYYSKKNSTYLNSGTITPKYDFFSMGVKNYDLLADGINSVDLVGGIFFFEEVTTTSKESIIKKDKIQVDLIDVITLILAMYLNSVCLN